MGQWDLARAASRPPMDGGLVGPGDEGPSGDVRLLGGCHGEGDDLSSASAGDGGSGTQYCPAVGGLWLDAGLLGLVFGTVCVAPGLLGAGPGGFGLDARPLCLDAARIHLCGRLLGLLS